MGYEFTTLSSDIDEKAIRDADPKKLVLLLANAKTDALLVRIIKPTLLITSDQVVIWNGQVREKPESPEQAKEYLKSISQYPSQTVTSVVVTNTKTGKRLEGVDAAKIYFRPIPDEVIDKLVRNGTIFDYAGGFSTNDPLLFPYVDRIEGEVESVLGLPKTLTQNLLEEAQ